MQRLLMQNELRDPLRVYERVRYLFEGKVFVTLGLEEDSKFAKCCKKIDDEAVAMIEKPSKFQIIMALSSLLRKMLERPEMFKNMKITHMMKGPETLLQEVTSSNFNLDGQLQEDFLNAVSFGIQQMIDSKNITESSSSDSTRDVAKADTNLISNESSVDDSSTGVGSKQDVAGKPLVSTSTSGLDSSSPKLDPGNALESKHLGKLSPKPDEIDGKETQVSTFGYAQRFQPMADVSEMQYFDSYAEHVVGEPRKMIRIINSYMLSRVVLDEDNARTRIKNAREKLLKLLILCEQWPYRMSWFLVIAENLEQEKYINRTTMEGTAEFSVTGLLQKFIAKRELNMDPLDLTLLEVYQIIVQSLIHSPKDWDMYLLRDADPQIFEMLLSFGMEMDKTPDPQDPSLLRLKDVASSSINDSLRSYVFNLHQHMIDKAQGLIDHCIIHQADNELFGVYQKKPQFFNRTHSSLVSVSESTGD